MIMSIWGKEGSGKSSFGLSFPKPLFHLDLDLGGFERAVWRVEQLAEEAGTPLRVKRCEAEEDITDLDWKEWDVVSKPYLVPVQMDKLLGIQSNGNDSKITQKKVSVRFPKEVVGVKEMWQQIIIDIVAVCRVKEVKTIMTDSATQLWWIAHTGFLQEKQEIQLSQGIKPEHSQFREKLLPVEFPNNRMRELIYTVRSFGKNLVMAHYPKDIYAEKLVGERIESFKTGDVEPDGFKHTVTLDDIVIWCYSEIDKRRELYKGTPNPDYNKSVPRAKISLKCGLAGMGMKAVGLELPSPSYEGLMELQTMMRGE